MTEEQIKAIRQLAKAFGISEVSVFSMLLHVENISNGRGIEDPFAEYGMMVIEDWKRLELE